MSKPSRDGFTPKELEIFLRARRQRKAVSFERGFPAVVDISPNDKRVCKDANPATLEPTQARADSLEPQANSPLAPVENLLSMVGSLDTYATRYSEALSQAERRRQDCTHMLEGTTGENGGGLTDEVVLSIGKKLKQICEERRAIKNEFEVFRLIERSFSSQRGKRALNFFRVLISDIDNLRETQRQRVYAPRTDEFSGWVVSEAEARGVAAEASIECTLEEVVANGQ